eukprot:539069-Amphidinium_carterae.1
MRGACPMQQCSSNGVRVVSKVFINDEGLVRLATEKYSSSLETLNSRTWWDASLQDAAYLLA